MIKFKNLSILFCLMTTSASAAVIVNGIDALSDQEKDQVFSILINPKHDAENVGLIDIDLKAALPTKNLNPYWVPDTLYQVIQSYFDVEGLKSKNGSDGAYFAKQADIDPKVWKKEKETGIFNKSQYPTNLEEHKAFYPFVVNHWARLNNVAHRELELANFQTQGAQHALSKIFETAPQYQKKHEARGYSFNKWHEHTSHLKKNEAFLNHALRVEEQTHTEGKLLLWRYAQPLAGNIPDLPFKIEKNDLDRTLNSPLEYYEMTVPRISYGSRLLEGFFGDGSIYGAPYSRIGASACTFSFVANDVEAKRKGHNIPNPIVYSLALSPEKIKELNNNLYLYHPREAMPQHIGIYGTNEGFHPGWLLDYQSKESTLAWLELMQGDDLQVHLINGNLQGNPKNNQEVQKLRTIYNRFFNKTMVEDVAPPKPMPTPTVPPQPQPTPVPTEAPQPAPLPAAAPQLQPTPVAAPVAPVKASARARVQRAPRVRAQRAPRVRAQRAQRVRAQKSPRVRAQRAPRVRVQKRRR